jgi:pimeloyl-ACP methyl ester carboxylesterase
VPAITAVDGRTIEVYEGRDSDGLAVVVHHGTPASGLLYESWLGLAEEQGIRLVGYDRPGYGGSARAPGRSVVDAARDLDAIADGLGLDRYVSWGISGGGPHVLACAALCDERLAAVASLASVAPFDADGLDWFAGMGEANLEEFGAVLEGEDAIRPFLERERETLLALEPEQLRSAWETLLGAADREVLTGDLASFVVESGRHGLREDIAGWLDDDFAFAKPWGFDVAAIDRPVLLLQGRDDRFVPAAHGDWLAARIPNVDARITPEDGHLTLIERRVREAHEWLLAHAS